MNWTRASVMRYPYGFMSSIMIRQLCGAFWNVHQNSDNRDRPESYLWVSRMHHMVFTAFH